jgi:pyruvate/2-oxoglutarate dehydrogenase complex dihydrolipoamide dehydrogenase (E3) component
MRYVHFAEASQGRQPTENGKPEIRRTKSETNPKHEARSDSCEHRLEHSDLEFVSDFELRASRLKARGADAPRSPADAILVALGRQPNVESLDLAAAHVEFDPREGVTVDDRLRTTNKRVYAAGDVCSRFKFTHAADAMARIVIQNALFLGRKQASALTIPWCTYTSPELAHVGLTAERARHDGVEIDTFTQPFSSVDRNVLDGGTEGFVRIHVKKRTDTIVGGTIVDEHAGDLIGFLSHAMTHGQGLKSFSSTIFPYPTRADVFRKLGDAYNRTRLTPTAKKVLAAWLKWR